MATARKPAKRTRLRAGAWRWLADLDPEAFYTQRFHPPTVNFNALAAAAGLSATSLTKLKNAKQPLTMDILDGLISLAESYGVHEDAARAALTVRDTRRAVPERDERVIVRVRIEQGAAA